MRTATDEGCKLDADDLEALDRLVPGHLHAGLRRYVEERRATGGFLRAVLSNDLFGAIGQADSESLAGLVGLVQWIYCHVPSNCYGSPEKVTAWLEARADLPTSTV